MEVTVPHHWRPRQYQRPLWNALESGVKRACCVWHRRAGKDLAAINWIATQAFQRRGQYWHILPTYRQGRKIVWEGMTRDGRPFLDHFPEETIVRRRDDEMTLWFANGSMYQVVGADDPDRLVGANPVGVVFSEYSVMDYGPKLWNLIRPILVENGGWALFIYTPRGRNHGYRLLQTAQKSPNWFAEVLGRKDTGAVTEEAVEAERAEGMPDEMIAQEFDCSFDAPLVGSYFGDLITAAQNDGRICRVPYDPAIPVDTSWDLGMADATAIWCWQRTPVSRRAIDYFYASGVGLSHYVQELQKRDYVYRNHYLPHDAAVRELGPNKSRVQQLRELGLKGTVVPKLGFQDGIQALRAMLPITWIDEEKCATGIQAFREYIRKRLEGAETPDGEPIFLNEAVRDWTTHPVDSARTYAVGSKPDRQKRDRLQPDVAIV